MRRESAFVVGLFVGLLVVVVGALTLAIPGERAISQRDSQPWRGAAADGGVGEFPEADIQIRGPFPVGERVSLAEAMRRTPYRLPVPPTDERTGQLTGVWIDPGVKAIAFLWDTDLRIYVYISETTQEQAVTTYKEQVEREPNVWMLTTARGQPALGGDLGADPESSPSSLTFSEQGLEIQMVSPSHTLEQLRQLAGEFGYE